MKKYLLILQAICLIGLVAPGYGQGKPATGPRPTIFDFKSYDLGKITWYASASLPPDSSVDTIRAEGTPTTPTVTLRSAVQGGTGILFCFVQLPDPIPACSGRVTIGDIDGNDEAFWNGKSIGKTTDWGVAESRPRMYTVDKSLLKPGINVFALRMSGPGGRPTFGVKSKTLTFCLTPAIQPLTAPPENLTSASRSTIKISRAREAILAADPELSATLLQRKRPSFGRFGEFEHNGLPSLSEISPTRVATRQGPAFDILLDRVLNIETARSEREPGIDGWHRLARVNAMARNTTVAYTLRQNVLYPGAVIHLESGSVLELRVRFPEKTGHVLPMSKEEKAALFGADADDITVYGFYPAGDLSTPAILAATGLSINLTQASSHIDISLARKSKKNKDARIYLFYPAGLYRIHTSTEPASLSDIAKIVRPDTGATATLKRWMQAGLYEPTGVDEYFAPVANASKIRIFQATRYRPALPSLDVGGPLLMRPPQVDFAAQALGYPVDGPATSSTGVLAFSGDMHYSQPRYIDKADAPEDNIYIISYDLPVPPLKERAPVEFYGQKKLGQLINQYAATDLGSTSSVSAVDALYKSRAQSYEVISYLTPAKRQQLAENSKATIRAALGGHFWNRGVEPFSGLNYWYTSFLQGPYFKKYDQDWGNGLSLYGLETYVKYTGDWKLPTENWDAVERIFSWFTVTDDWEWMRASNSAHGHGTGAGDCQNATYAAAVAYAKLAHGAGRESDYYYGLYTLARAALPGLNRFAYNDFGVSNGFKADHSIVLGFHEGQGFLEGSLEGYPWNATSNISSNGIQSETHDLFMTYGQDALRNYEQIFEKNFPRWMDGQYHYDMDTLYKGNSGYITLPHIYLRARLNGDSFATLNDYLDKARSNDFLWWLAPPVIAEMINKKADNVIVTEWDRLGFLGGKIEKTDDDDRRKLTLSVNNWDGLANTVAIKLPTKPHRFDINGGPVPLTDSQFEDGVLKLKIRRPGQNVITVVYSED